MEMPHCLDLNSFIIFAMDTKFSTQIANLWRLGVLTLIWGLWDMRNRCAFEGAKANTHHILRFVKAAMIEADRNFNLGYSSNSWSDYSIGRRIGINCKFAAPPSLIEVIWWPPLPAWIKANTDGSALGSPGRISAGGVFRDAHGSVRGCFHLDGGIGFAFEAEILGAMTAIEIAHIRGWNALWLETDSTYVAYLLDTGSAMVPWRFINGWRRILHLISLMDFRVSHIYREGNAVADAMAHHNTPEGWWPHSIPLIADVVARDMSSPRFYRVV